MSKEEDKDKFSLELIGVLEGHGGEVTSLVWGEDEKGPHFLFQRLINYQMAISSWWTKRSTNPHL